MGRKLEITDVQLTSLFPSTMAAVEKSQFMAELNSLDAEYDRRKTTAARAERVMRYVATTTADVSRVGLEEVPVASEIGGLRGPNNLVVIQTKRYSSNPLIIKGPGAGIEVTAAGVFADCLKAAEVLRR
jgi:homoserine dehydrogenase